MTPGSRSAIIDTTPDMATSSGAMRVSIEGGRPRGRDLGPVQEPAADGLWLLLIVAMAVTVLATRVFLGLTGYPQLGGAGFHLAHVLWGGLLLFVAVTLPLSLANRYALWLSALLGGIGAGLVLDEVGKFVTSDNDYFVPLAMPIIYAFILACVWLYLRVIRRRGRPPRALLYHALTDLKQVLDRDLDPFEHRELVADLREVLAVSDDPDERRLAEALLSFVDSREVRLTQRPDQLERAVDRMRARLATWPTRRTLRLVLVGGFALVAAQAVPKLLVLVAVVGADRPILDALGAWVVVSGNARYVVDTPTLLLATSVAVAAIGFLALAAAALLALGRDVLALRVGVFGLIVALTVVDPFTFYFSQAAAILEALLQVAILALASLYRWRFLGPPLSTRDPGVDNGS